MVMEFYFNVREHSASSSTLSTFIRGKEITFYPKSLAIILKIPHMTKSQFPYAPEDVPSYKEMCILFGLMPWPTHEKILWSNL
jgi:hypothetical protein